MNHAPSAQAMSAHALPPRYNPNADALREPGSAAALQAAQQTAQREENRADEAATQAATQAAHFLHGYIGDMKLGAGVSDQSEKVKRILRNMDPTKAVDLGLV
jgi:hypothetical protein